MLNPTLPAASSHKVETRTSHGIGLPWWFRDVPGNEGGIPPIEVTGLAFWEWRKEDVTMIWLLRCCGYVYGCIYIYCICIRIIKYAYAIIDHMTAVWECLGHLLHLTKQKQNAGAFGREYKPWSESPQSLESQWRHRDAFSKCRMSMSSSWGMRNIKDVVWVWYVWYVVSYHMFFLDISQFQEPFVVVFVGRSPRISISFFSSSKQSTPTFDSLDLDIL